MCRLWLLLILCGAGLLVLPPGALGARQPAAPPVELRLTTDRVAYLVGTPVVLTLTITNPTDTAITLTFPSSQIADFTVSSPGGTPVWRWGQGRVFLTVITTRSIPPGGSLTVTERWDQRNTVGLQVPTGVYAVTAQLMAANRPSTEQVAFVIGEAQPLPAGCSQITSAFPDKTPAEVVAATVDPRDVLTGIWRFDGTRWQGWSRMDGAPNDLTTINARDRLRICLSAPARWITPV